MAVGGDRGGEIVVELLRDVARQLQMLLLIVADRNMGRAIDENVGCHQHRIVVEANGRILPVLARFLLELGHAVEPAEPRDAIKDPGELRMLRDPALVEDDIGLGIDAAGEKGGSHFARGARELLRIVRHRHRMQIDDAIDARMRLLHLDEALDRAEIIAEVQIARRLDAGKHALGKLRHRRPPRPGIVRAALMATGAEAAQGDRTHGLKRLWRRAISAPPSPRRAIMGNRRRPA